MLSCFILACLVLSNGRVIAGPCCLAPGIRLEELSLKQNSDVWIKADSKFPRTLLNYDDGEALELAALLAEGKNCVAHSAALHFALWLQGRDSTICGVRLKKKHSSSDIPGIGEYYHMFLISGNRFLDASPELFSFYRKSGVLLELFRTSKRTGKIGISLLRRDMHSILNTKGIVDLDEELGMFFLPLSEAQSYLNNFIDSLRDIAPKRVELIAKRAGISSGEFRRLLDAYQRQLPAAVKDEDRKITAVEAFFEYLSNEEKKLSGRGFPLAEKTGRIDSPLIMSIECSI